MSRKTFLIILFSFLSACSSDNSDSVGENVVSNEQESSFESYNESSSGSPDRMFALDDFIICMQKDGLDFYHDDFDSAGDPTFIYYEKPGLDPGAILNEDCYVEAEALGIQGSNGFEGLINQLLNLFYVMEDLTSDSGDINTQNNYLVTNQECTEYGCINVTNGLENWIDGEITEYGLSFSQYNLWKEEEVIPDNIDFENLKPLEQVARWGAQSTVHVIGDRCIDKNFQEKVLSGSVGYSDAIHLTTDPLTGFFISKDHIMTASYVNFTLEDQENSEGIQQYGSSSTGYSYFYPCEAKEKELNNSEVNTGSGIAFDLIQGEGPIIQLFDGTYASGKIVYTDACNDISIGCEGISVIKLEKFSNDPFTLVETWNDWESKRSEILPLPIKKEILFNDEEVVYIHHPLEGNSIGGWYTTTGNLSTCNGNFERSSNFQNPEFFWLDRYVDEGSQGAPVLDSQGYVVGMINSSAPASSINCGNVARSNDRNNLGILSSFLYDGLDVAQAWDVSKLNKVINQLTNIEIPLSPDIKEIYKWPLNSRTPNTARFESYDYGNEFTVSGFPVSQLNSGAFDVAKQATLIFVRQTGCTTCDEDSKDENFAVSCACSAFAVTKNLIVTNNHCVPAMNIGDKATFKTYAGQNVEGTLIGKTSIDGNGDSSELYKDIYGENMGGGDPIERGDVALFRTTTNMDLNPIVIADSDKLKQFDPIISVGHPAKMSGSGPFVVTAGSIVGEDWGLPKTKISFFLPVSKGSSGSGVFNLNGELVAQVCCGGSIGSAQRDTILYSKYGLVATEIGGGGLNPSDDLNRGVIHPPRPYNFSQYVEIELGTITNGAPSNYIKEMIEKWAPGELGY